MQAVIPIICKDCVKRVQLHILILAPYLSYYISLDSFNTGLVQYKCLNLAFFYYYRRNRISVTAGVCVCVIENESFCKSDALHSLRAYD